MFDTRNFIIERLKQDLIGPGSADEVISDRPSDRYLTGILFPPHTFVGPDQDDDAETVAAEESGGGPEAVLSSNAMRPASAGLSFAICPEAGSLPAISVRVTFGRYMALEDEEEKKGEEQSSRIRTVSGWKRSAGTAVIAEYILGPEDDEIDLAKYGAPGLSLYIKCSPWLGNSLVTLALSNSQNLSDSVQRREVEEKSFFQVSMEVRGVGGSKLVPRPLRGSDSDEDGESARLIYRDAKEFAVGHTCSAEWDVEASDAVLLRTEWIPAAWVASTNSEGDEIFSSLRSRPDQRPFHAEWLASADPIAFVEGLTSFTSAYAKWVEFQKTRISALQVEFRPQAEKHLVRCEVALRRMNSGVGSLQNDPAVRLSFQLANRAMRMQRLWSEGKELEWRPFQLGFCLLTLDSTADFADEDRGVMDLLWFPTGGGKTEAYLLLTAFTLFLRRLREGRDGGGVAVLMRYTLRLLTIQQYQRAAAVICACELIRQGKGGTEVPGTLAESPTISLGLWVGDESSPNRVADAIDALQGNGSSTPAQLKRCPCCLNEIRWQSSANNQAIWAICKNVDCEVGQACRPLPVWTVDEDLYRELPSLVIGTADKFAQIVRKQETGRLFGINTRFSPPELIIQDELHLISGPLGTMAGIYEIAVDELCSSEGRKPKVIGSTATIRRAEEQILALFDRQAFQFPPPGLDHSNSGFSVSDPMTPDKPGRMYAGVTTTGRSAKFTLQAVSASLLQSACAPPLNDTQRNPYWTLVTYFNSLRELGGAVILMQDDVNKSISDFARRRGEPDRSPGTQVELTSRVKSSDIPKILDQLGNNAGDPAAIDIALASNMISVGVDIPRLGLMVVNGQPKGIAEYIQATSRVGRGNVAGLILTVYNANKARDRSHYETFRTWHQCLYREVEATSVTPFAPRARDRALHAALVAIARHKVVGLGTEPVNANGYHAALEEIVEKIVLRASRIDPDEEQGVRQYLNRKVETWLDRGIIPKWWDDWKSNGGLLVSAERVAQLGARRIGGGISWSTPNSLRNVEASVEFVLRNSLRNEIEDDD